MHLIFWIAAIWLAGLALPDVCPAAGHGEYSLRTDLAFWGIIYFVLFLLVFRKLIWDWWLRSMQEREQTEAERIAAAEREGRQAAELLSDRLGRMEAVDSEVRELLDEARRDAEHTRSHILETAEEEAEAARRRAIRDVERTRDQTLKEIFDDLTNRTIERTREALSARLSDADQQRLIRESLARFRQQAG
jgi:F-type H+-transporting ATPase subunit b